VTLRSVSPRAAYFVVLALSILVGCPTGYRLVHTNGEPMAIDDAEWDRIDCTVKELRKATGGCATRQRPKVLLNCTGTSEEQARCYTTPKDRKTRVIEAPPKGASESAQPLGLTPLITFVHLSDAQLKEEAIHMDGALSDVQYDALTNGALRDPDLEKNDDAVLLATVLGINHMKGPTFEQSFSPYPAPAEPTFVIHTGDSVDAGVYSELVQFIASMDTLDIPWYNVVGNHDNLFFGTFPPSEMKGLDVLAPYVPIVDTDRFMRFHSIDGVAQDPSLPTLTHRNADHVATMSGTRVVNGRRGAKMIVGQASRYHGFDLACAPRGLSKPDEKALLCPDARGYYAFDAPLADGSGNLRSIVLNTAEIVPTTVGSGFDRRSKGNMYPEQLRWLEQQLAEDRPDIALGDKGKDVFIVYGHHDLRSFLHDDQAADLKRILFSSPRVLAYVAGHTHADDVVQWTRPNNTPFWEIIGGSTLVYPELGQILDLLQDGRKNLYIRVSPFRQQLGDSLDVLEATPAPPASVSLPSAPMPSSVATAMPSSFSPTPSLSSSAVVAPAKPPVCPPLEDGTTFCYRLAKRASIGRAGAKRDNDADKHDEGEAVEKTAGILPVGIRIAH
jgi:3',5'-cyclic AMP phosphodiesterase CpdA